MSNRNAELVRSALETFNSEDIDAILTFFHPDAEVTVASTLSAEPDTYRGHKGVRRYWESFQDAMEEIRFQAEEVSDVDWDSVLVVMRVTARGRTTAITVEQRPVVVCHLSESKIRRIDTYASTSEPRQAVGLPT